MPRLLFLLSLASALVFATAPDTTPPEGSLLFPESHALLTENLVRLAARAQDAGSGVRSVRFYASYYPRADTLARPFGETGRGETLLVAEVKKPPYEFIWDCAAIPDQDIWRLCFYCDIEDSAGNITPRAGGVSRHVVLDRNPAYSTKLLIAAWSPVPKKADGLLDDWAGADTQSFQNDNNRVVFSAAYDRNALYLFARVEDAHLSSKPDSMTPADSADAEYYRSLDSEARPFWIYDEISFYLDTRHDRASFRKLDDFQLNAFPSGFIEGSNVDLKAGIRNKWTGNALCAVRMMGTLNNDQDRDTGFVVELAIPWSDFDLRPEPGLALGFELFNVDNDLSGTKRMSRGWSVSGRFNNNNPSEWGTLELGSKAFSWKTIAAPSAGFLLLLVFILYVRRKRNGPVTVRETPRRHPVFSEIEKKVAANLADGKMDLASLATLFRMSPDHLGKIIRKESGLTYPQYLNKKRIEKARDLLMKQDMNITEIAFAVGYESLEYFVKMFKKETGATPSDFRSDPGNRPAS